jgi:hypothetical protein
MKKFRVLIFLALAAMFFPSLTGSAHAKEAPPKAFFVNLKDGDTVSSPVKIEFGILGMKVAPAGTNEPNTGHFHLLIDTQLSDEEKKYAIVKDDQHQHFGKGQTETTLTLSPGKHSLQLVMADGNHMLQNPPVMSKVISITVK